MESSRYLEETEVKSWEEPRLGLGYLASLPLFVCYELGLLLGGATAERASSELVVGALLSLFGGLATALRWAVLLGLAVWAAVSLRAREDEDVPRALLRTFGEGLLAAVILGPLLLSLAGLFDVAFVWDLPAGPPEVAPSLDRTLRLVGASGWEEVLFRLGAYGLAFLFAARVLGFFGLARPAALLGADLFALLSSSVLFAAFHLEVVQRFVAQGGERFDPGVFLWRLLAGLLLAGLFRWRGLGVAAWAHGLFNAALALGAGPGLFHSP